MSGLDVKIRHEFEHMQRMIDMLDEKGKHKAWKKILNLTNELEDLEVESFERNEANG